MLTTGPIEFSILGKLGLGMVLVYFSAKYTSLNIEPLEARGATSSDIGLAIVIFLKSSTYYWTLFLLFDF